MKCVICKNGETAPGRATVPMTRESLVVVVKEVPAKVCDNCGEYYLDYVTTAQLDKVIDDAEKAGVEVLVQKYAPTKVSREDAPSVGEHASAEEQVNARL